MLKELWIFTFFIFLNQIIDQINWSVDKFLLGRLSGTIAVAVYGVGSQINTLYLQFSTSISNVFVPKVNRVVAETNDNVLGLILSGFIFFGYPFIKMWAGNEYKDAYVVAILLIAPVTVPLIQNLGIEIQRAKNMHKARAIVYLFIAIANIFISIPLIRMCGPTGAALGTTISLVAGNIIIAKFADITNVISLGVFAIVYTAVYGISIYFLGMNDSEKKLVEESVGKILRKQRTEEK